MFHFASKGGYYLSAASDRAYTVGNLVVFGGWIYNINAKSLSLAAISRSL